MSVLFFWLCFGGGGGQGIRERKGQEGILGDRAGGEEERSTEMREANRSVCCIGRESSSGIRRRRISDWVA